jgi:hypothetical protein
MNIRIPESIRIRLEYFAKADGVSVDDYVATVLSQRVAVADADSYVQNRAARGSADKLIELLDKAPNVEPESFDQLAASGEQDGDDQSPTRSEAEA